MKKIEVFVKKKAKIRDVKMLKTNPLNWTPRNYVLAYFWTLEEFPWHLGPKN